MRGCDYHSAISAISVISANGNITQICSEAIKGTHLARLVLAVGALFQNRLPFMLAQMGQERHVAQHLCGEVGAPW